jgi:hypothetical protein
MRRHISPPVAGGCDFLANPLHSSLELRIQWAPHATPAALPFAAIEPDCAGPNLRGLPFTDELAQLDRRLKDLVQLVPTGPRFSSGSSPPSGAAIIIPMDDWFVSRLAYATALWGAIQKGVWRDPFEPSRARRLRLILGLRAIDGRDDGASYRDLAKALYGADSVPAGPSWKTHDLRSRVMRLVSDANDLRASRYLSLIRPRR